VEKSVTRKNEQKWSCTPAGCDAGKRAHKKKKKNKDFNTNIATGWSRKKGSSIGLKLQTRRKPGNLVEQASRTQKAEFVGNG